MSYVLEHPGEFERLERQSALAAYDYRRELEGIDARDGALVLDAGCGSGVVTRYLAARFPRASVLGCDYSVPLLREARDRSKGIENITFEEGNLLQLSFEGERFDLVVSRFVFHHHSWERQEAILSELVRVLKPGGRLVVIDVDGIILNLHPQTPRVSEGLRRLAAAQDVDLFVGRRLPYLFSKAGLSSISWKIETIEFRGESKHAEVEQMKERFGNASGFYQRVIGAGDVWSRFQQEYLECLDHPYGVSFFNKFVVSAVKT
jgi:ubiquinone/menaquinone biosynthesis C-methylase UbiE